MQRSSLPVAVKTLMRYEEEGTLNLHPAIQRKSGLWSPIQKSLFIDSMLREGYIIPDFYFKKDTNEGVANLEVLDGLQRLSSVFAFVRDEWSLSSALEPVKIDGTVYEIAGKKFSELDADVQAVITQYRFTTYRLENCTPEELEDTFSRLNGGLALSKIQGARAKMGVALAEWVNELLGYEFFTKNLNLTLAALRREDDLAILLTTMMLLEDLYFGGDFHIKTSASVSEAVRFAEYMRKHYTEDRKDSISLLVEYLDMAFDEQQQKFLKRNNALIIMYVAYIALDKGIEAVDYGNAIIEFFNEGTTEAYQDASGSGNVRLEKVNIRLRELMGYVIDKFPDKFPDDDEKAIA